MPDSFIKSIPRSTSFAWKFDTTEKFVGHEHAIAINDNVEELKLLYDEKVALEKRLFVSYTRIKIIIIQFLPVSSYRTLIACLSCNLFKKLDIYCTFVIL
jgi:hypothetical protein|tara:strand:+ start:274 stop:573 length:300 start_codon:yes stop_codon:yes gene_type:complete